MIIPINYSERLKRALGAKYDSTDVNVKVAVSSLERIITIINTL